MKLPIAIATLILAIAAGLDWQLRLQLAAASNTHSTLVAAAAQLGIATGPTAPPRPIRHSKRERDKRDTAAKLYATELIAFVKEMDAIKQNGDGRSDEATKKRAMDLLDRMTSLDPSQLKILIAAMRADKDVQNSTREELISLAISSLAGEHPQAALALLTEASGVSNPAGNGRRLVAAALGRWAQDDPSAALQWLRNNTDKFPDLITDEAKSSLLAGAAARDPRLAFKLIAELGFRETEHVVPNIVAAAKTPEARTATLAALRDYSATLAEEPVKDKTSAIGILVLARGAAGDGFQAATDWLATAKLSPQELANFSRGLDGSIKPADTSRWIEWAGTTLPADSSEQVVRMLVSRWTQSDYQAAGKWLATTPESPAKTSAIQQYAETVSRYEPETAAQWALTLPPGAARDATLKQIYHNWPRSDPAASEAAAAFGKLHDLP
ncbi:MAG: hypothetical protein WCK77_18255 [Verrucomicrobiota bacterium]